MADVYDIDPLAFVRRSLADDAKADAPLLSFVAEQRRQHSSNYPAVSEKSEFQPFIRSLQRQVYSSVPVDDPGAHHRTYRLLAMSDLFAAGQEDPYSRPLSKPNPAMLSGVITTVDHAGNILAALSPLSKTRFGHYALNFAAPLGGSAVGAMLSQHRYHAINPDAAKGYSDRVLALLRDETARIAEQDKRIEPHELERYRSLVHILSRRQAALSSRDEAAAAYPGDPPDPIVDASGSVGDAFSLALTRSPVGAGAGAAFIALMKTVPYVVQASSSDGTISDGEVADLVRDIYGAAAGGTAAGGALAFGSKVFPAAALAQSAAAAARGAVDMARFASKPPEDRIADVQQRLMLKAVPARAKTVGSVSEFLANAAVGDIVDAALAWPSDDVNRMRISSYDDQQYIQPPNDMPVVVPPVNKSLVSAKVHILTDRHRIDPSALEWAISSSLYTMDGSVFDSQSTLTRNPEVYRELQSIRMVMPDGAIYPKYDPLAYRKAISEAHASKPSSEPPYLLADERANVFVQSYVPFDKTPKTIRDAVVTRAAPLVGTAINNVSALAKQYGFHVDAHRIADAVANVYYMFGPTIAHQFVTFASHNPLSALHMGWVNYKDKLSWR